MTGFTPISLLAAVSPDVAAGALDLTAGNPLAGPAAPVPASHNARHDSAFLDLLSDLSEPRAKKDKDKSGDDLPVLAQPVAGPAQHDVLPLTGWNIPGAITAAPHGTRLAGGETEDSKVTEAVAASTNMAPPRSPAGSTGSTTQFLAEDAQTVPAKIVPDCPVPTSAIPATAELPGTDAIAQPPPAPETEVPDQPDAETTAASVEPPARARGKSTITMPVTMPVATARPQRITGPSPGRRQEMLPPIVPRDRTGAPEKENRGVPEFPGRSNEPTQAPAAPGSFQVPEPDFQTAGSAATISQSREIPGALAFGVRLMPVTPKEAALSQRASAPRKDFSLPAEKPKEPEAASSREAEQRKPVSRRPEPAAHPAPPRQERAAGHETPEESPVAGSTSQRPVLLAPGRNAETRPDDTAPMERPATSATTTQPARTEAPDLPEPLKMHTPARDIQLQVNRGDQRVDVRLSERAGEVRVAVRTIDTQLAGALREDLPALSARLEQTGFRTETWHAAALSQAEHPVRTTPSLPSGNGQDTQDQSRQGGRQQQESQEHRRPREPVNEASPRASRKRFAWLMSHLS